MIKLLSKEYGRNWTERISYPTIGFIDMLYNLGTKCNWVPQFNLLSRFKNCVSMFISVIAPLASTDFCTVESRSKAITVAERETSSYITTKFKCVWTFRDEVPYSFKHPVFLQLQCLPSVLLEVFFLENHTKFSSQLSNFIEESIRLPAIPTKVTSP